MVKPVNPQHIAVACDDNIINLMLALPLFQTLRQQFPQAKITAIVPPQGQGFIQRHPSIDHVEIIPAQAKVLFNRRNGLKGWKRMFLSPFIRHLLWCWRPGCPKYPFGSE